MARVTTTVTINATPSQIWPTLIDMEAWTTFQDAFEIDILDDSGTADVDDEIRITSDFPIIDVETVEKITVVDENESFCWEGFDFSLFIVDIPIPSFFQKSNHCIDLILRNDGTTLVNNYIEFKGLFTPFVHAIMSPIVRDLFEEFNEDLASLF